MGKTLYLECYSGISGDMMVEALLGLGADRKKIEKALKSLPLEGIFCERLLKADITERARDTAVRIFNILSEAEAKSHSTDVQEIPLSREDPYKEIVMTAVCLDDLDIREVIVPVLYEGRGLVRFQEELVPVPVPAVVNIMEKYGLKLKITDIEGELITPVGAAIVAGICTSDRLPEGFCIEKTGTGVGKQHCQGILRAMLLKTEKQGEAEKDMICRLETDIDDCSGETMGRVMNLLLKKGAREVHYVPVFMKKNRPAYELTVLCKEEKRAEIEQVIFEETTTIGIRRTAMERTILKREMQEIDTSLGKAVLKVCTLPDGKKRAYPEYDIATALADLNNITFREAYNRILDEWEQKGEA